MTPEEKAAKEAAKNVNAPEIVIGAVIDLQIPEKETFIGSVELINFKPANKETGGKFEKDTHIVSLSIPTKAADGSIDFIAKNVFITAKQFKEYGCAQVLYKGNYVKLTIEHCKENVTGYKKQADDDELTAHDNTFDAFVGVVEANVDSLMIRFESIGMSERLSDRLLGLLLQSRSSFTALNSSQAINYSAFGGN